MQVSLENSTKTVKMKLIKSTAIGWDCLLNLLAFCAYDFSVFAAVHTAWKTAKETGSP
jgi:hypothetical protein